MKDETGTADEPNEAMCLDRIKETLKDVKEEYAEVEKVLKKFYGSSWAYPIYRIMEDVLVLECRLHQATTRDRALVTTLRFANEQWASLTLVLFSVTCST